MLVLAGAAVGFIENLIIWFIPNQQNPGMTIAAGTIKGALVALLISAFVDRASSVRNAVIWGAVLGLAFSAVIFLSKGGWETWDAPYVVPAGAGTGILLGALVRLMNGRPAA
jgi:hypothetical protein